MVSCCIFCNLTTKNPFQLFGLVNDQVKRKMIELATLQMSHASHQAIVNATKYAIRLATTSKRGKVLIFKSKAPSFHTKEFSYINFFPQQKKQIFGFWVGQSLKLRRNTCFHGLKSSLAVNFHVPKPERLALMIVQTRQ